MAPFDGRPIADQFNLASYWPEGVTGFMTPRGTPSDGLVDEVEAGDDE